MADKKYFVMQDIFDFLFRYQFATNDEYPFNRDPKNLIFSWGQVLIPAQGIREMVQNKVSDVEDRPLKEIKMMYQVAFIDNTYNDYNDPKTGIINQDISLTFRYDKEYKYGDINKSICEVCFYILQHGRFTNDFYIISDDSLFEFFSYYIIDNQWGIGRLLTASPPCEKYRILETGGDEI